MKKNLVITLASLLIPMSLCFTACSNKSDDTKLSEVEQIVEEDTLLEEVVVEEKSTNDFMELAEFKDDYPAVVHLFQNKKLSERLIHLLGRTYDDFSKYWEVETPIIIEDNVLFTTGCEQHNCFANQFILIIDLAEDNINVFRIGATPQDFEENGTIKLPPGIEAEFATIIGNVL